MPPENDVTVGELARQVRDVFSRFEGLARRLEDGQFVRTDLYLVYKEAVNTALGALQTAVTNLENVKVSKTAYDGLSEKVTTLDREKVGVADHNALDKRVVNLESTNTWLLRLVVGFIILGVLGAVFAATGLGG